MRTVLLDPSGSRHCNVGDLAMLQVAVARWRALWPSAQIAVMTEAPERLTAIIPDVIPVEIQGRSIWLETHLLGRLHRRLERQTAARLEARERRLKMNAARSLELALALKYRIAGEASSRVATFLHWVRKADVIAVTGGGTMADPFPDKAAQMLDTLSMAVTRRERGGGPVAAIFGQGFGPLEGAALRARAGGVLPALDFISMREARTSTALLRELGVDDQRTLVTGDDAIELAYEERQTALGSALGINVRIASYASVETPMLQAVRQAVLAATERYKATVIPLPILMKTDDAPGKHAPNDTAAIGELLAGVGCLSDDAGAPDSSLAVIRAVAGCRIVITGSYHAAVFALAQGIPAIGLIGSPYYRVKFGGLAGQFDGHCHLVDMSNSGCEERLTKAIDWAWHSAESVRPCLLAAASRQIQLSRQAYQAVASLADSRIGTAPANER